MAGRDLDGAGRGLRPLAIAFWLAPAALGAQQMDAGRLALREGGQRVAVESFRVWRAGPNLNSVANIEPSGNREGEFQVGLGLDGQHRPLRYELRGPGSRIVEGTWTVDRVRLHLLTAEGERWKELPFRGPGTVLEVGVAHHYLVLITVLQERGGRATAVIPSEGASVTAQLVGERADQVRIGDRTIVATRYDVRVGDEERRVWIDAEGRLLRVLDPASGREAIRLPPR